jgi:hypothetical protein
MPIFSRQLKTFDISATVSKRLLNNSFPPRKPVHLPLLKHPFSENPRWHLLLHHPRSDRLKAGSLPLLRFPPPNGIPELPKAENPPSHPLSPTFPQLPKTLLPPTSPPPFPWTSLKPRLSSIENSLASHLLNSNLLIPSLPTTTTASSLPHHPDHPLLLRLFSSAPNQPIDPFASPLPSQRPPTSPSPPRPSFAPPPKRR